MKTAKMINTEKKEYSINDTIVSQPFDKLQVRKLVKTDSMEILSISLQKNAIFPEHSSPTDAHLIMLAGSIVFYIGGEYYELKKHDHFSFPKEEKHWVKASENSKFLIIR